MFFLLNCTNPWWTDLYWNHNYFPSGDHNEVAKIHWRNLKIFSRTTWPISTKLGTKHPWVKRIQVCWNEETFNSLKDNNINKLNSLNKRKQFPYLLLLSSPMYATLHNSISESSQSKNHQIIKVALGVSPQFFPFEPEY